ncbi:MAG: ABC transporter ATP-binding protein [Bacillota bacterium]
MDQDQRLHRQLAPLWRFTRPVLPLLLLVVLLNIVQVAANMVFQTGLGTAFDAALADTGMRPFLRGVLIIAVGVGAMDGAFFLRSWLAGITAERVCFAIRSAAVRHLSQVKTGTLQAAHSGDFISRLSNDLNLVRQMYSADFQMIVRGPLQSAACLVYMIVISPRLTLISLAVIPILMYISTVLSRPLAALSKAAQAEMAQVTALAQDAASGITVTKAFNLQRLLAERFFGAGSRQTEAAIRVAGQQAKLLGTSLWLELIPILILFGLGGYEMTVGRISMGDLVILINLSGNLAWPLEAVMNAYGRIKAAAGSVERIIGVFELPTERAAGHSLAMQSSPLTLQLNNVSFAYTAERPVFSNFNLELTEGETLAIVGPSGCGKSTLLGLLLGLLEPTSGEIRLNGQLATETDPRDWRQLFSYVPQDATLFDLSVRENIRLGRPDASDAEVEGAARQAFAHEFIVRLPDGYDTVLGEEGVGLSGGQKQRLAIARAILKQAPFLLLDEATSALDTESEARVQEAIARLQGERTLVIVAHRLSTIRSADRIVVVDDGQVVEEGTYPQLMARNGLFASLYQKEFAAEEQAAMPANAARGVLA